MLKKCSENAKNSKKLFFVQKNAKKNYFDTMNMILGLITKIENLGLKHFKNHGF